MSRVLLVEDDSALSNAILDVFKNKSIYMRTAKSGAEAISEVTEVYYDLVILDLTLPDMNGFEVLGHIRKSKSSVSPVIILTNENSVASKNKAAELGIIKYLVKSQTPLKQLLTEVQQILAGNI